MNVYRFREGLLDTVTASIRPLDVSGPDGPVGRIVRGELEGTERAGTFCWQPDAARLPGAAPVTLGIVSGTSRARGGGVRGMIGRLARRVVAPEYLVVSGDERWTLRDKLGENVLYFAVSGEMAGQRLVARSDWDDSVEVTLDGERVGRLRPATAFEQTEVEIDASLDPTTPVFGVLLLLVFVHRIHSSESALVEELFE